MPTPTIPHRGMNLREAIKAAQELGCTVKVAHRTGELVFSHPRVPKRVRTNLRRKDTPYTLTTFLIHLHRAAR